MAQHHDFKVKNGLVVNDSATFGNTITGTSAVFTGTITAPNILDSAKIQAFTSSYDSADTLGLIDSAYVQARQITYSTADFADSAFVTAQIDALIDGAPGTLDTLNEIAAALNDDDSAYATLVNLINAKSDFDSNSAIGLIDSTYVQARQDFAYGSLTGTPTNVSTFTNDAGYTTYDSVNTINLIDSAYVQLRQDFAYSSLTGAPNILDSADVQSMMDSAGQAEAIFDIVSNGTSAYTFTGDGFSTGRDNPTLYLTRGHTYKFKVRANGHPFEIRLSDGGSAYNNGVTNNTSEMQDIIFTPDMNAPTSLVYQCIIHSSMVGNIVIIDDTSWLDSSDITNLIDAAYIQARQADIYRDSAFITNIIDSAYVSARTSAVAAGTDSATVISLITSTVDSAYVALREANAGVVGGGLDSAAIIDLIDSAYVQAREAAGGGGASYAFKSIHVSGQDNIVADSANDILVFEAGSGITLTTDPNTDTVTITSHSAGGGGVADGVNVTKFQYIATEGQKLFADSDVNGNPLVYNPVNKEINVFLNGLLLIDSDDFTQQDSANILLVDSASAGDRLTVIKYTPPAAVTIDSDAVKNIIDSDWVQARQTVYARGELEINKFYYTATASQTLFQDSDKFGNVLSVNPSHTEVYLNGILLVQTDDYSITDNSLTLVEGADSGYSVAIIETIGRVATQNSIIETKYYYTTPTPTTILTGADDNSRTLDISLGVTNVFLNGILLKDSDDYSTTSSSVTLVSATDSNDLVTILNTRGQILTPTLAEYHYTADSGQLTVTGIDDGGATLSYVNGQIQVFLNGILLRSDVDYSAGNGSSISFTNPLDSSDDVVINTFSAPGTYLNQFRYIADSGQLSFSGVDLNNNYLAYEITNSQIFLNGILLTDSDYTATNGNTITLTSAANLNDDIIINSFDLGTSTRRVNTWSDPSNEPYQLVAGDKIFIKTDIIPRTLTLPTIAIMGDEIRIIDATGNASSNNITVARNGHKIQAADSDFVIDIDRAAIGLVYYNTTQGWLLTEK